MHRRICRCRPRPTRVSLLYRSHDLDVDAEILKGGTTEMKAHGLRLPDDYRVDHLSIEAPGDLVRGLFVSLHIHVPAGDIGSLDAVRDTARQRPVHGRERKQVTESLDRAAMHLW
jgi:hypothetical protein